MVHVTVFDLIESDVAALISSCYVLFDVGMVTLNQYILLDPILLCFMMASVMGMVKGFLSNFFHSFWINFLFFFQMGMFKVSKATHNRQTFTLKWWSWLLFTGTMISATISVKFVGLFVILLVGLHTINDLWIELGDLTKPVVSILHRIFCCLLHQLWNACHMKIWPNLIWIPVIKYI